MAWAFGSAIVGSTSGTTSTKTVSHTVSTNDNRILVAVMRLPTGAGLATATYNGVAMTRLHGQAGFSQFFYLIAPATGANNLVFTHTVAGGDMGYAIADYNGVNQDAIDNSAQGLTGSDPATVTLDPVVSSLIIVGCYCNATPSPITGVTSTTVRASDETQRIGIGDINSLTDASTVVGMNMPGGANSWRAHSLSIAEFGAAAGGGGGGPQLQAAQRLIGVS